MILDKMQLLIDQKLIRGIGGNGMEYTVIAQVLNLPKDIVRLIQKFDLTWKNPKLIYINTSETVISLEDSILTVFLHLMGFDIVFFVPTGYQSIEKYFNGQLMEEHQIGEYKYDLQVPDLNSISFNNTRHTWRDKFLREVIRNGGIVWDLILAKQRLRQRRQPQWYRTQKMRSLLWNSMTLLPTGKK